MSEILHLNLHREFFAAILKTLLSANKRLNTAYVLKESFGQLWSYEREGWARRFFENWRASLKWQRLKPYEKFAATIVIGTGSPPTAGLRTRSRSASSRGSTTRSG
jgi:transposase